MNLKTNPELFPLIEWWEKDGKSTVIWLLIAAIAVGGWYGWKAHRASVITAASDALVSAYTTEELEDAVSKYSSEAPAGTLKIRLAKSYYDAGRFEEALAIYTELEGNAPDGFADIPVVGKAQALEGLKRFAEAQQAFEKFAAENPKNYLALTAKLGAVRAMAQGGKKAEALKKLEALEAEYKDDELSSARVKATLSVVKRYEVSKAPTKDAPVKK